MWERNVFRCFRKSIKSEINKKSPGNNGPTSEFYKHFPNELATVLLDIYNSKEKLVTMGVTSRPGISMIFYMKKVIKKILQNYRSISV